jgi:hypothetical protein
MADETYRLALRAKIAHNQWDGTIPGIYAIWNVLFDLTYLIVHDNQDMTMDALMIGLTDSLQSDLLLNGYLVPKPEGVRINYAVPPGKVFAYGVESSAFGGYDEGYWIDFTSV